MERAPSKRVLRVAVISVAVVGFVAWGQLFGNSTNNDFFSLSIAGSDGGVGGEINKSDIRALNYAFDFSDAQASRSGFFTTESQNALNNTTITLSQNVYGAVSSALGSDAGYNRDTAEAIVDNLSRTIVDKNGSTQFRESSIREVQTSKEAVGKYARELATSFASHGVVFDESAFVYVESLISNGSDESVSSLVELGERYKKLGNLLADMSVPHVLKKEHAQITNTFYQISLALSDSVTLREDPVKAMLASGKYAGFRKQQSEYVVALTSKLGDLVRSYSVLGVNN